MKLTGLQAGDARAVYKNTSMDLRLYKRIQLFTHAERLVNDVAEELKDGDFSVFMRLGTDVKSNFYEYEVPLHLTAPGKYNTHNTNDQYAVWPGS